MVNIEVVPEVLRNPEIKFCRIRKGTKKPFEEDWTNRPYCWEEISKFENENYGVLCGHGNLIVIDADDEELQHAVEQSLPKTFRVRTGSGGTHDYYFCKGCDKKLVLQTDKHWGEVQAFGSQVVGANSIHPNGNKYEIVQNLPIAEISSEDLINCVKPFMREVKEAEKRVIEEISHYGDSDINSLSMTTVVSMSGFKTASNGEVYGANPWHGSSTGMNFWISPSKNVAHCFRCNCGVSVAKAVALNEGIIKNCSDSLQGSSFVKTLETAYDKYGLKRPDKKSQFQRAMEAFSEKIVLAEKFAKIQPIYYDKAEVWWLWNSEKKCWELKDEVDITNKIYLSLNINTIDSKQRNEILQALKQVGRLQAPQAPLTSWIQFRNGIIDINNPYLLMPVSSEYFFTNPIPWNIGVNEDTPSMDRIFKEWVGEEHVRTLYEILAYCLLADYPIHRLFCLIGAGLNGKSKFLDLLRRFVGEDNVCSTELDVLINSRFEIGRLHRKLVCQMGETNFNEMDKTSILKKLTGGDLIGFEYKNKTPFEGINYAKIIISTNNLPSTSDKTIGFYRRWFIIDFPNQFTEKKDILKDIPSAEYENLAYKCIFILKELLDKREFHKEGSIEERAKRYEDRSNPFDKFWEDNILEEGDKFISKRQFSEKLNAWCHEHKFREISDMTIARHMKERNVHAFRREMEWAEVPYGQSKPRFWVWEGIDWR